MSDATPAMKSCSRKDCEQQNPQPASEFYKDKSRADGLANSCKGCQRRLNRAWAQANPDKNAAKQSRYRRANPETVNAANREYAAAHPGNGAAKMRRWREANREKDRARRRADNLMYRFNITVEQYDAMLKAQDGVCARCKQPETMIRYGKVAELAVDHDHACCPGRNSCGKCVRQLLCISCNIKLGFEERRAGNHGDHPECAAALPDYPESIPKVP